MSTPTKAPVQPTEKPSSLIPSAEALTVYAELDPRLPRIIVNAASAYERGAVIYATVGLIIGGVVSLALIGGFIYLVMNGHAGAAGSLLGAGALAMVAGFRSTRL